MASASMPRSSLSMPSTRARGVSASIIHAAEARRRNTSQIRPAIAARSPEPAKRCAVPHSFSAFAAGTRWASMVSISSMAADSRAAGVIQNFRFGDERRSDEQNLQREINPHREQHYHSGKPRQRALLDVVRGHENSGMGETGDHEYPGQQHDHQIGMAKR